MKKIFTALLFIFCTTIVAAQKENFDLITYTPPKGWKKEVTENITTYTIIDKKTNNWCQIGIVKSTASKGNVDADFESEWQDLAVRNYKVTEAPELNEIQETDGWKIKTGGANFIFNNSKVMALLTTASGYNRCMSIIATTNNQVYLTNIEALLASVEMEKPAVSAEQTNTNTAIDDKSSVLGTWIVSSSDNSNYRMKNGIMNYIKRQYTFYEDGSYNFVSKAFDPLMDKILLGEESGSYQVSGTNVTLNPKKSILEGWSKKDGTDKWGKHLNTQNIALEKITYSFTKHYFSGIQIWALVLTSGEPTTRDGPFSNNKSFNNAWYYNTPSPNNLAIELPGGLQPIKEPVQQITAAVNTAVVGTWGVGTTVASAYNMHINEGSIVTQYIFNANGTYSFHIKTFRYQLDKLLLTKETGTYQINSNNITINPQKSVIEAWSRKDGTDNWGKLLSSDKKDLEKITYQFLVEDYGSGKVLVLRAGNITKRDGRFNNNSNDAWFYPVKSRVEEIKLPD
jgi:hypothetical protein